MGLVIAAVMINPCAGLSASDPMWWILGCFWGAPMPYVVLPLVGALVLAHGRLRLGK